MQSFKDYKNAREYAQSRANELGMDQGLELNKLFKEYQVFSLPSRDYRCGHELRCEVVSPENISKTMKGHGYAP